jgi:hypothetical protein
MDTNNFQRIGSISNAHVGNEFEEIVLKFFGEQGLSLARGFSVSVGAGIIKKARKFDFGSDHPAVLVECKSHSWTSGGNVPSAKITVWNEAMYYFLIAPAKYRKILFALKSIRGQTSLATYYVRCYGHLIPENVEIWEYDVEANKAARINS